MRRLQLRTFAAAMLVAACSSQFDWHLRKGNAHAAKGQFADAVDSFKQATELRPNDARAHRLLAQAHAARAEADQAEREFRRVLELAPRDIVALTALAETALQARNPSRALELVEGIDDPSDDVRVVRAEALLLRANADDAHLALSVLGTTKTPRAEYVRGSAMLSLKRYTEAQLAFDALEKHAPVLGRYGLARLAAAQGRAVDTLLHLRTARSAATGWSTAAVAQDPAFEFVARDADFLSLNAK